ncbi:MAG: hypothetical protein HY719_02180 [Planctomycetes bacterium]|nr:hypothetical protein [Planctomycetota bacterium]
MRHPSRLFRVALFALAPLLLVAPGCAVTLGGSGCSRECRREMDEMKEKMTEMRGRVSTLERVCGVPEHEKAKEKDGDKEKPKEKEGDKKEKDHAQGETALGVGHAGA